MFIVTLVRTNLWLALVALIAVGVLALVAGAHWFQRTHVRGDHEVGDDMLVLTAIVGPTFGLFALMVAFTFGQALNLEASTFTGMVSTQVAAQHLKATVSLLPDADRQLVEPLVRDYVGLLDTAIGANYLQSTAEDLRVREIGMRRGAASVTGADGEILARSLDDLFAAVRQLHIDSMQRIPTTVFAIQTLYYCVCFLLLGYKAMEHRIYTRARLFLVGLAVLFAVVMVMSMNVGRPGLHAMLFDPLPK